MKGNNEKLNVLYNNYKGSFVDGLYDILFQLMIGELHRDKTVCFFPLYSTDDGISINITLGDSDGKYHLTPAYIRSDVNVERLLEELNSVVFELDSALTDLVEIKLFESAAKAG